MRTLLIPVLIGVLAFGTAGAVSASPASATSGPWAESVDLGSLLNSNGTFAGGVTSGSVSLAGWQLTSDLAAGEARRFSPSTSRRPAALAAAAWSALRFEWRGRRRYCH